MHLKYQDKEDYWQDVDFDEDKFFELVAKEAKYKKAGRPKHVSDFLSKCIRGACSKTNIYGIKLDSLIKIQLHNF